MPARRRAAPPRSLRGLAAIAMAALAAAQAPAQSSRAMRPITVYTAFDAKLADRYAVALLRSEPSLSVRWVRAGIGELTDRLLAERRAPRADAVFGLPATSLEQLEAAGAIEPYAPSRLGALGARYRDAGAEPAWVGIGARVGALCYHAPPGRRSAAPRPDDWFDLTRRDYEGALAMPDPRVAVGGYLHVAGWLQIFDERDGWLFQNAIFQNVVAYTVDDDAPCLRAGRGEVGVGISTVRAALAARAQGLPIDIVFPSDRVGWDVVGTAIVAGTRRRVAARAFLDWTIGDAANEIHRTEFGLLARGDVQTALPDWPRDAESHLARENDLALLGRERSRILGIWAARYATKSER